MKQKTQPSTPKADYDTYADWAIKRITKASTPKADYDKNVDLAIGYLYREHQSQPKSCYDANMTGIGKMFEQAGLSPIVNYDLNVSTIQQLFIEKNQDKIEDNPSDHQSVDTLLEASKKVRGNKRTAIETMPIRKIPARSAKRFKLADKPADELIHSVKTKGKSARNNIVSEDDVVEMEPVPKSTGTKRTRAQAAATPQEEIIQLPELEAKPISKGKGKKAVQEVVQVEELPKKSVKKGRGRAKTPLVEENSGKPEESEVPPKGRRGRSRVEAKPAQDDEQPEVEIKPKRKTGKRKVIQDDLDEISGKHFDLYELLNFIL